MREGQPWAPLCPHVEGSPWLAAALTEGDALDLEARAAASDVTVSITKRADHRWLARAGSSAAIGNTAYGAGLLALHREGVA